MKHKLSFVSHRYGHTGLSEVVQLTLQLNLAVAEEYYFDILLILKSISLSHNKIIVLLIHFLNCKVELTYSTLEKHHHETMSKS